MVREIDVRVPVRSAYEHVQAVLLADPRGALGPAPSELRMEVGDSTIGRAVSLAVGAGETVANGIRVPLAWGASSHPDLFPTLTGELRLVRHGTAACDLQLIGSYRPPLGVAGAVGDRMVGHRIADHTIRAFLEAAARRLVELAVERAEAGVGRVVPPDGGPASEYRDERTREMRP